MYVDIKLLNSSFKRRALKYGGNLSYLISGCEVGHADADAIKDVYSTNALMRNGRNMPQICSQTISPLRETCFKIVIWRYWTSPCFRFSAGV